MKRPRDRGVVNPFRYGDVATGGHFTDRQRELRELVGDMRSGQNVVLSSPRRYGKTSLVTRAIEELRAGGGRVAYLDLLRIVDRGELLAALTNEIYGSIVSPVGRAYHAAAQKVDGLLRRATLTVTEGAVSWKVGAGSPPEELLGDVERVLALPVRHVTARRPVAVVFDEFQQVTDIDESLPGLMRSVFQHQQSVSHIFLGSRQHLMRRLFSDRGQPMYRIGRPMTLERLPRADLAAFLEERFRSTGVTIEPAAIDRLLDASGCHPQATQQLAHATWVLAEETGGPVSDSTVLRALEDVLASENARFVALWEGLSPPQRLVLRALAAEGGMNVYREEFITRRGLGVPARVQASLRVLERAGVVEPVGPGSYRIDDPFLPLWLERD